MTPIADSSVNCLEPVRPEPVVETDLPKVGRSRPASVVRGLQSRRLRHRTRSEHAASTAEQDDSCNSIRDAICAPSCSEATFVQKGSHLGTPERWPLRPSCPSFHLENTIQKLFTREGVLCPMRHRLSSLYLHVREPLLTCV